MSCQNFTLYLDSSFPRSLWKNDIRHLTKLCQRFNLDNYSIEIVHLADEPRRGFHDGVFTTPTILLEQENGRRQILGNFAETEQYLNIVQLSALATEMQTSSEVRAVATEPSGIIPQLILARTLCGVAIAR
jgi:hypothetical protein